MNKIIKLALIILAVVAISIGALYLMGGINTNSKSVSPVVVERCMSKVDQQWASQEWNLVTYTELEGYIKNNKKNLRSAFTTTMQYNETKAASVLSKCIKDEWNKSDCDSKKIKSLISDCATLKKNATGLGGNKNIKEVDETYALYNQCLALSHSGFEIQDTFQPGLDFNAILTKHRSDLLSRKSNCKKSPLFSNIENITTIKNGLASVESRIAASHTRFLTNMTDTVKSYYSDYEGPITVFGELVSEFVKVRTSLTAAYNNEVKQNNDAKKLMGPINALGNITPKFKQNESENLEP